MDIIVISPGEKHHKSDIAIVSGDDTELIKDSSFWKMIIGYDVIVPVISKRPIF